MERQTAPSISGVKSCPTERSQRVIQNVQTIVVTGGSIGNVPGEPGVVEFVRVNGVVENGSCAFEDVDVACQDEINGELV